MIVSIKTVALPLYLSCRRYREYDFFARFPVGFTWYGGRDHPVVVVSSEWNLYNISIFPDFFCKDTCHGTRRFVLYFDTGQNNDSFISFLKTLQMMNIYSEVYSLKSWYKRKKKKKKRIIFFFLSLKNFRSADMELAVFRLDKNKNYRMEINYRIIRVKISEKCRVNFFEN